MENMLRQCLLGCERKNIRNDLERMQCLGDQIRKAVKYISYIKYFGRNKMVHVGKL